MEKRYRNKIIIIIIIILHHQLGVHKRCARWMPHQLTEEQKVGKVQWCMTMLEKYDSGHANSTWNIVSGDET